MDLKYLVVVALIAFIAGFIGSLVFNSLDKKSNEQLIKEFYEVENAVYVSPHSLRKAIQKGDKNFVLVDLRSEEEYNKEHIVGAVNIPAYKDKDTPDYGARERIVNQFKELIAKNPGKDIIVYCYSMPCMTGRKIGLMLTEHGIYVKHLGIGWNEWRYFWNLWNHEHEWNITNVEDYIAKGKEPGTYKGNNNTHSSACPINNKFGC
ncbi:MAG: rhodanese-like domain-containing protein [Candidatus Anstonellales archaeon]